MRRAGLTIEDLGDEMLVYDREADAAHCLTPEAAAVWRACDGKRAPEAIASAACVDRETGERALAELREKGLLGNEPLGTEDVGEGISRRQAVGRLAAAAATPLVVSVAAPTAWASHSVRSRTPCPTASKQCPVGTYGCKNCPSGGCVPPASSSDRGCEFNKTGADFYQNDCCPTGWRCTITSGNLTCTHI